MAFNVGDIGNFNFKLPTVDLESFDKPSRDINLTEDEEKKVIQIINVLEDSGLTTDALYKFFTDWQSDKTKSLKKYVISLSFLLTMTMFSGVNIIDLDFLGISVEDEFQQYFLYSLLVSHVLPFYYFLYLRNTDKRIYILRTEKTRIGLDQCIEYVDFIDRIIDKYGLKSVDVLFNDFRGLYDHSYQDIAAYNAIKFYKDELKESHKSYNIINLIEIGVVGILAYLAFISIICSFYG